MKVNELFEAKDGLAEKRKRLEKLKADFSLVQGVLSQQHKLISDRKAADPAKIHDAATMRNKLNAEIRDLQDEIAKAEKKAKDEKRKAKAEK